MNTDGAIAGCRFFQIGYVVNDIDLAVARFTRLFGAQQKDMVRDMRDQNGAESMIQNLSHLMLTDVEIELIEPRAGWASVYSNPRPELGSEPFLHHIGYMADSDEQWEAACATFCAGGLDAAMTVDLGHVRLIYFDTRRETGHFTELVQRR